MSIQRLSNAGQSGFRYKSLIAGITPIPSVPVIGTATALTFSTASVEFTAPGAYAGSTYTAISSPGGLTGTSASSPITVSGLLENTAYTFTVTATNATGTSGASAASNSITTPIAFAPESGYDALATVSLSTATSTIAFSGIPTGYKHLQVRLSLKGSLTDAGIDVFTTVNGDTASSNYSSHYLGTSGNGGTFQGYNANRYFGAMPGTNSTSVFSGVIMDFLDYANTNKFKTCRCIYGYDMNGSGFITMQSMAWLNTSAITSLTFASATGGNFQQYSQAALYGVK